MKLKHPKINIFKGKNTKLKKNSMNSKATIESSLQSLLFNKHKTNNIQQKDKTSN